MKRCRARALGVQVLLVGVVLALFVVYSVHAALPPNAITLPLENSIDIRVFAPQGWAFFTRDPQEARVLPFVRSKSGAWRSANLGPFAQPRYAFGLDRKPRAQGVEIGLLLGMLRNQLLRTEFGNRAVPCTGQSCSQSEIGLMLGSMSDGQWSNCEKTAAQCISRLPVKAKILNTSPSPTLCGQVAFVDREPLPWVWASSGDQEVMPSKIIRVHVKCSKS